LGSLCWIKEGKQFFFEKKNQKNFACLLDCMARFAPSVRDTMSKSFCFFFQKEALSSVLQRARQKPPRTQHQHSASQANTGVDRPERRIADHSVKPA
jgi:hypothetical protein